MACEEYKISPSTERKKELDALSVKLEDKTERYQFYLEKNILKYQDENWKSHTISFDNALRVIEKNDFCILPDIEQPIPHVTEVFAMQGIAIEREQCSFDGMMNDIIDIMTNKDFLLEKQEIEFERKVELLRKPNSFLEFEALLKTGFYIYFYKL